MVLTFFDTQVVAVVRESLGENALEAIKASAHRFSVFGRCNLPVRLRTLLLEAQVRKTHAPKHRSYHDLY